MKVTTAVTIDTRRLLKNGKYPIKLRVTFNGKQKYYPANISLTPSDYEKIYIKKPRGEFKKLRFKFDALEQKANGIIENMPVFDYTIFKKRLYSDQNVREDVYNYYLEKINSYRTNGNIGTASNYKCSMVSLKKFRNKLKFIDVTVDFLEKYETWLLASEKSVSTVGIYLRPLRAIINSAIADGTLSKAYNYPFGSKNKRKYQIPSSRNIKKSLTLAEIKLFFNYKSEMGSWEEKALNFWIFSYLGNGMNMKDIAHLRFKDIDDEYIKYIRAKTKKTNSTVNTITIPLNEHLRRIIETHGNKDKAADNFIFPMLKSSDSLEKQRASVQQFIKMVNKYMRSIAAKLGINKPCTTYYARHSFSTVLKRSGANVQFISEALGHSSINTTKAYLDSFEDDMIKEMAKALTNF